MTSSGVDFKETDSDFARRLAAHAGEILLKIRCDSGLSGKDLGNEGDALSNAYLINELRKLRPNDAILSEEEIDDSARLNSDRVWIIDPLDGTREYAEGRDDWAVHVALAIGGIAAIGAVALPSLGVTLCSANKPEQHTADTPPKMLVSRSRPAAEALAIAAALGAELLPMGSAGAKAMAIVRGEADIYLHTGGQYEWDNCAPVAVAQAAGLHCSRIDGSPMRYNNADPYLPDLLICRPELAEDILAKIAAL
jgi:3'(2'), 5'-bisphosphate nucleotidase